MLVKSTIKNTYVLFIAVLAIVLVGAGCQKQAETPPASSSMPVPGAQVEEKKVMEGEEAEEPEAPASPEQQRGEPLEPGAGAAMPVPGSQVEEMEVVRTFEVTAKNFEFSMKEIRVKKGDKVKIIFKNEQGFHDWTVDAFQARTAQISQGNTATVEFVANQTGTFEYYCSVDGHRQLGMKGNLVVE